VIGVNGKVQSHQVNKVLVSTETKLVCQVETVILVSLDRNDLSILENIAVNLSSNGGELCNQVHGVLECVAPVVLLVETLGISLCERRLVLKSSDCKRELSHRVKGVGASINELLDKLGDLGTSSPLSRQGADLLLSRNLAGQKKPEETFRKGLLSSRGSGKKCLAFRNLREKG